MMIALMPVMPYPFADLSQTPLAEFEELINMYGEMYALDPLDVAALVMVESGGNPNVYNEKSKATGLGQVMPKEAGAVFKDRPTIEELKDPEMNIDWTCKIFAQYLHRLHSVNTALYQYSGGKYWENKYGSELEGLKKFNEIYWTRFTNERNGLLNGGFRYKTACFTGHVISTDS